MEQAVLNLMNHATDTLSNESNKALSKLERILDNDDSKSEALTGVEVIYFKLGLKAGLSLVQEINK